MDWKSLCIGVAGSVIAAVIVAVVARAKGWIQFAWSRRSRSAAMLKRMEDAGVTNFYASRDDYARYRGAPRLLDYLATAKASIHIASHWMAHGVEMEGVVAGIAQLVRPPHNLRVVVGIVSPTAAYVASMASFFDISGQELLVRTQAAVRRLSDARQGLSPEERTRFTIKLYDAIPIASVIILDAERPDGRLQMDIKPYKTPRRDAFALELGGPQCPLYVRCRDAWLRLLEEAREVNQD